MKNVSSQKLKDILKADLPGEEAQRIMMARPESNLRFDMSARKNARKSAVLLLLYEDENETHFPLILRPEYPGAHSGQISLPGGRWEDGDGIMQNTALREAEEEVGVRSEDVEILGMLTELYIPVSNYIVYPYIGYIPYQPEFVPEEREVQEIIQAPVSSLHTTGIVKEKTIEINQLRIRTPYFDIRNQFVWGATAMILSEFREITASLQ